MVVLAVGIAYRRGKHFNKQGVEIVMFTLSMKVIHQDLNVLQSILKKM